MKEEEEKEEEFKIPGFDPSDRTPLLLKLKKEPQILHPSQGNISSSGRLPKDLWNYQILQFLDLESLTTLEYTSKYFFLRLSANSPNCECGDGTTQQGTNCRSIWALTANREDFSHETFGNNLACGIIKKLTRRKMVEQEAPEYLSKLYRT